ncbi:MAG TPA: WYL domain-containing protein [Steroidobacteraceae bacterium]|nr:WYL domain-containing protein [Steroidobacteraceae bacterium]
MDIAKYMAVAPGNIEYDKREKVYKKAGGFSPARAASNANAFLSQLQSLALGTSSTTSASIGWRPPHDVLRVPTRQIRSDHLVTILKGIRERLDIEVSYQSMRQDSVARKFISPHAIAYDSARWHVRAWCHQSNEFRDFTIARIQQIHGLRPTSIDPASDFLWHSISTVILKPKAELSTSQRAAIETEFVMTGGELRVSLRRAMIFYFAKELQLLPGQKSSPRSQPIEWVNRSEFTELLASFRK